jgi:hopene-associated glycosyltransferase HpnB
MLGLSVAAVLAAVVWVYLIVAHGGYWLTTQRLPRASQRAGTGWPDVHAVIPARDEAAMLPVALPTLAGQEYPGRFSITLVDDCSSDGTAEIAARIGKEAARPLRVIDGKPREPGWAGKVWAMTQGLAAASPPQDGPGDGYVLFTDADIAWEPGALKDLVTAAEGGGRDMVSQMALLRTETAWERVLVPAFVYFFAQLYPFRRVNAPRGRTAAAAGGCMLVRRAALAEYDPLNDIAGALIDDVALGRLVKRRGGRTWLGLTTRVRSVRPYDTLASLWHMVARSAYTQLRYSPPLLAGTVLGLLLIYLVPPAAAIAGLAAGDLTAAVAGLAGWALMTISYLPMLRLYRLSPLRAPALPVIAALYVAMTVDSARRHYAGRGGEWKGRTAGGQLRLLL